MTAGASLRRAARTRSSGSATAPRSLLLGDQRVRGKEQPRHGGSVLQRRTTDSQWIDDAHLDHAEATRASNPSSTPRLATCASTVPCVPGVRGDEVRRLAQRAADDLDPGSRNRPSRRAPRGRAPHAAARRRRRPRFPRPLLPGWPRARSTRCWSSASSALVGAPTRITATFPDRDPIRSESTSSSIPNVARSSSARSWARRNSTPSADPAPPMIAVLSAVTLTWDARPRCSGSSSQRRTPRFCYGRNRR